MLLGSALLVLCEYFFFFFFQAEDGIRDLTVTGVQTCALPILGRPHVPAARSCPIGGLHAGGPGAARCRGQREYRVVRDESSARARVGERTVRRRRRGASCGADAPVARAGRRPER